MSQPIRGQGGHLVFLIGPKIQTWKRTFRSCFMSKFVEFRSAVAEEKSKMSQPIRGQDGHLVFPIGPKNTNLIEDIKILLPVKFRWILFSGFREVENVSANQRPGRPSFFCDRPKKTQTWQRMLRSCFLSSFVEFRSAVSEEKSKMSQPIRGQGGHLVFLIGPKNTNLVEDIKIFLPVKFRWIPFGLVWFGFLRIYVDLAVFQPYLDLEAGDNQSLKIQVARRENEPRSSCSASQELNHSATAAPFEFRSAVSEEKSKMSQPEAKAAILFFRSARKTQKW